jgi:hypothetical protein
MPRTLIHSLPLLILGLCLAAPVYSAGEQPPLTWYVVELIIFAHNTTDTQADEIWPQPAIDEQAWAQAVPVETLGNEMLKKVAGPQSQFSLLPQTDDQLAREAAAIERAQRYFLLAHVAWRQPGLAREQAVALRITRRKAKAATESVEVIKGLSVGQDRVPMDAGGKAGVASFDGVELDGPVRLILSRYLHFEADLVYVQPNPAYAAALSGEISQTVEAALIPASEPATAPVSNAPNVLYHLHESRRMRSNELHYLDHPKLGLIVKVTPYVSPVAAAPAAN